MKNNIDNNKEQEEKEEEIPINKLIVLKDDSSSDTNNKNDTNNLDYIIDHGCCTKYPLFIIIGSFIGFISDGIEMNLFNFAQDPIEDKFSGSSKAFLSACIFIGVGSGSLLCSFFTKKYGRVFSLNASYFLLLISHFFQSLIINSYVFIIFRILVGFALGVIVPIALNLLSEFLPNSYRGFFLLFIWFFFTIGNIFLPLCSYLTMPDLSQYDLQKFLYVINIFHVISFLFNFACLVDSPRNLIFGEKYKESKQILESIRKDKIDLPQFEKLVINVKKNSSKSVQGRICDLFGKKYTFTTFCIIFLFFVQAGAYYGIYSIYMKSLDEFKNNDDSSSSSDDNEENIDKYLITASLSLLSYVIGGIVINLKNLGRKSIIAIFMILQGICLILCIIITKLFTEFFTLNLLFANIHSNVLLGYVVEVYPTKIRDLSSGFILMTFRVSCFISQFLFKWLFDIDKIVPYIFQGICLVIGTIITLLLPIETKGRALDVKSNVDKSNLIDKNMSYNKLEEEN